MKKLLLLPLLLLVGCGYHHSDATTQEHIDAANEICNNDFVALYGSVRWREETPKEKHYEIQVRCKNEVRSQKNWIVNE
jgi:hypothetical protein